MVSTEEGWHTVEDGVKLYTKAWKPEGEIKAKLVFVHGFSDHCNAYGILFPTLAARGIEVFGFDQRGWGRSVKQPSERGLTGPTTLVLSDITSVLNTQLPSPHPVFLMGHSMGGAEVLTYAALGPSTVLNQLRGFLAEAPFIALDPASRPWRITVSIGRMLGGILPAAQMMQKLDAALLSRDVAVQRAFVDDPLCHDTGTLEGLAGMLDRAAGLEEGRVQVGKAVKGLWIGHGTEDHVCSFEATKRCFENFTGAVQDKELKVYDGWFHKLHAEPGTDKETFAKDVGDWILARVN